ncbi:cytochrome P450 [Lactarius quietus]|nr:cytochrome P450 [Lactarius quietus]
MSPSWIIFLPSSRLWSRITGPKGLPLVGDVLHIVNQDWLSSPKCKDKYGKMMYVSALGQGVLVINSQCVAIDLLESRPNYISTDEIMTVHLNLTLTLYGDLWRHLHHVTVEGFSKSAAPNFYPIQGRETLMLALAMIKSPPDPEKPFQRHTSSIMLSVNYNFLPVESEDDPVVIRVVKHMEHIVHKSWPGAHLVEFFTWMRYIPSRFAKWKWDVEYWFVQDLLMFERLLGKTTNNLVSSHSRGTQMGSIKHNLSTCEQAWLVGSMLAAGGETMSTTLLWWLLTMTAYPEVQNQAHAELNEVVSSARPPTFANISSLPYICMMVKETLCWSLTIPFSGLHIPIADDWYEGTFIPKGTVCLQNMCVINSELKVFGSNTAEFDLARYLDDPRQVKDLDGREEGHMVFGFGRQVCPGRFVAEATLAIDIATLLWVMRFEHPEGGQGELDVRTIAGAGVTAYVVFYLLSHFGFILTGRCSHPLCFEYKVIPRFAEAEGMLQEALTLYG